MTCQVRLPGDSTWSTITNGSVKYRAADGTWKPVRFIRVRTAAGTWMECTYIDLPLAPINFIVTNRGNGKDGIVDFAWSPASGGGPVSSYRVNVYFQNDDNRDESLSLTTTGTTATITFPRHPRLNYWVDVTAINAAGESVANSNRIQVTLGPNPYIEYGGGWGPVEWAPLTSTASLINASSYWTTNNNPVTNVSDGNNATLWKSAGHALSSDSLAYEGIVGSFSTGASYDDPDPGIDPYYRKLAGVRYRGTPSGQVWVGFRLNNAWQGDVSLNGVTGATASYVQHLYVARVNSTSENPDGWRYLDLTGIYETDQVGAPGTKLAVTWGPALPSSTEGLAWSSSTRYRVDIAELQVGSRAWDETLNPFTVPAGSNIITYL